MRVAGRSRARRRWGSLRVQPRFEVNDPRDRDRFAYTPFGLVDPGGNFGCASAYIHCDLRGYEKLLGPRCRVCM